MKFLFIILILITGLGAVVFFPFDINGQYTCFFHRIIDHSHPVTNLTGTMLLENYMAHYAVAWWANIGLFAITYFWWSRWRKNTNNKSEIPD
jgi:hypothetical protein